MKTFLAKLPQEEGKAAYEQLIQGLAGPPMQGNPQMQMQMQQMQQMQMQMNMGMAFGTSTSMPPNPQQFMMEKNAISNQDILELCGAAPHGLDDERVSGLGQILRAALDSGNVVEDFLDSAAGSDQAPRGPSAARPSGRQPSSWPPPTAWSRRATFCRSPKRPRPTTIARH